MTGAGDLLHTASLFDTPRAMVGDMQRDEIARSCGIDLSGCNVCTIVTALNEFDLKRIESFGHRFETWPEDVRAIMERELKAFAARNGNARIEAITQAIGSDPKTFVLCLHWRPKQ